VKTPIDPTQAEKCLEAHGYTNPQKLAVACQCDGCTGVLKYDGNNPVGAFLLCTTCCCTYFIERA
jgi:hypothetical protein